MESQKEQQLLKQAQLVSNSLAAIKGDIEEDRTANDYPSRTPSEYLVGAMDLREGFRQLAEGIEDNQKVAQLQKQQIEIKKVLLEGLQYYKATLLGKIKECDVSVDKVDDYVSKPIQVADWCQEYSQAQKTMQQELEQRQRQERHYKGMIAERSKWEEKAKEKKEVHESILPARARRLLTEIQETSKLLGSSIVAEQELQVCSGRLQSLSNMLQPLRMRGGIEVSCSGEVNSEELEVLIKAERDCPEYIQALKSNLPIQQKDFKLTVADLSNLHPHLLIGVDRREDFTNQQVLRGLVDGYEISAPFVQPQSEAERNINNKYMWVGWLSQLTQPSQLSPQELISRIRSRVFSLQLICYLKDNIKKFSYFFPIPRNTTLPPTFKKATNASLQTLSFQEYVKKVHTPAWVEKYHNSLVTSPSSPVTALFKSSLEKFGLQEIVSPNCNRYLLGQFGFQQNKLDFVVVLPADYPQHPSRIILLQHYRHKEENRKVSQPQGELLGCLKQEGGVVSEWMIATEQAVNRGIEEWEQGQPEKTPFRLLLQLNRLMTLFALYERKM